MRQRNKEGVFYAVLMEQHLQSRGNSYVDIDRNADSIAVASMQASLPARAAARETGEMDQKKAVELYTDWARGELSRRKIRSLW
jgi:hypothetical protein